MGKVIGSKTSVHNGCFNNDYQLSMAKDPTLASKYSSTGGTATMLANRVSWFIDLSGPSLNLDSACSSSMVAFDIACQCLRNGDSTMVGSATICRLIRGSRKDNWPDQGTCFWLQPDFPSRFYFVSG